MIDLGMNISMMQAPESAPASLPKEEPSELRVEFTGVGGEYFGIWIVNLLLMIVTLGIYYPWAKVRRLRYFYGNTLVGGQPLDFHGNPVKMLKGYLLVGLLFVLYSIAGKVSATAGLIAFLLAAPLLPALLKSSMQFRMANTSWRGLRFRFTGSVADAYRAVLPLLIPSLFLVVVSAAVTDPKDPPLWYFLTVGPVLLGALVAFPWLLFRLKRYQHAHYVLGNLQTSFRAEPIDFYFLFFKVLGVGVLAIVLLVILGVAGGVLVGLLSPWLAVVGIALLYVGFWVILGAYPTSRFQNLVWSGTGNDTLSFQSDLRLRPLAILTAQNWLLMIVTVGFYWPFARVALARMRLEAITVHTAVSLDTVVSQARPAEGEAAGDAAGDFLGLDIGF